MALKILTVDDSKTIRLIVKKAFKPYDCDLFEGENGVEGLAVAIREKPDLIVLDITMPVMNGKEMLEKLKSEPALKDIPVIMLTAESGKDNVTDIIKLGAKDYMVKPFKGEQLIERATGLVKLGPKKEEKSEKSPSKTYFSMDGDILCLVVPAKVNFEIIGNALGNIKSEMEKTAEPAKNRFIFDLRNFSEINMSLIKLIILADEKCRQSEIHLQVVGNSKLNKELKGLAETAELPVYHTVKEAKAVF
jgi:CheY-like chemotaxis protein